MRIAEWVSSRLPTVKRPALRSRRVRDSAAANSSYIRRIMASLVAALVVVIGILHLPLDQRMGRIGWISGSLEPPALEILPPVVSAADGLANSALATDFGPREDVRVDDDQNASAEPQEEIAEIHELRRDARRLESHRILSFAQEQPELIGGLSAYYLHIEYPEDAREAGIQGRLLLSFVVETDGRASDIRVEHSLYPSCDSAAVRALRRSRFIAGRQDGEKVRVRMRLPVRFMLLDEPPPPSPSVSLSERQSGGDS